MWSSVGSRRPHGEALGDHHETGHLVGDVPVLILVAVVLGILAPKRENEVASQV